MMTATPPETQRLVRVEFMGLASPLAYPEVQRALARPLKTRKDREEVRALRAEVTKQEVQRQKEGFARFHGRTELHLGVQHGLSRDYVWGPREWIVDMPAEDVDILLKMEPRHPLAFKVHPEILVVGRLT